MKLLSSYASVVEASGIAFGQRITGPLATAIKAQDQRRAAGIEGVAKHQRILH